MPSTPEQHARVETDRLLAAAGWQVCGVSDVNIHGARGVAVREFPLASRRVSAETRWGYIPHVAEKSRALIPRATDRRRTFIAVSAIYQLIKLWGARRVLCPVYRDNLNRQSNQKLDQHVLAVDDYEFGHRHVIQ